MPKKMITSMGNLGKRILAGIIGIPVILAACYYGGIAYLSFALIVSSLALWEFMSMIENTGFHLPKFTGIIFSFVVLLLNFFTEIEIAVMLSVVFLISAVSEFFYSESRNPMRPLVLVSGIVYITIPFVYFGELNEYSGMNIMILIFVLIWICDTAAYFGGKLFGKYKLSLISPGKTVEGSITGLIFTIAASVLAHFIYPESISLTEAVTLGIITGIFSQAGDMFESLVKRHCNMKDSSGLIPGHGGMLDRFDSLLFVAPSVMIYLKYIK